MPSSALPDEPAGLGSATIDQFVPFHRSTIVFRPELSWNHPRAKQAAGVAQAMLESWPYAVVDVRTSRFGTGTIDQVAPSNRPTSGLLAYLLS